MLRKVFNQILISVLPIIITLLTIMYLYNKRFLNLKCVKIILHLNNCGLSHKMVPLTLNNYQHKFYVKLYKKIGAAF